MCAYKFPNPENIKIFVKALFNIVHDIAFTPYLLTTVGGPSIRTRDVNITNYCQLTSITELFVWLHINRIYKRKIKQNKFTTLYSNCRKVILDLNIKNKFYSKS